MPEPKKTLPKEVTVVPAYGRSYDGVDEVYEAWNSNKDFKIVGVMGRTGPYINKKDADRFKVSVRVRYKDRQRVVIIHPKT